MFRRFDTLTLAADAARALSAAAVPFTAVFAAVSFDEGARG